MMMHEMLGIILVRLLAICHKLCFNVRTCTKYCDTSLYQDVCKLLVTLLSMSHRACLIKLCEGLVTIKLSITNCVSL